MEVWTERIGLRLAELMGQCSSEVVIVAPFIKRDALGRLLESVRETVQVTCVTRWRPLEVLGGVADTEIWELLLQRDRSTLYVRWDLHAKYFRLDRTCVVGSANVTGAALGWGAIVNLELATALGSGEEGNLREFESAVLGGATEVDQEYVDFFRAMLQEVTGEELALRDAATVIAVPPDENGSGGPDRSCWYPKLRFPEDLYSTYVGEIQAVTADAQRAALAELGFLGVPRGLSKPVFGTYVAAALLQTPIFSHLNRFLAEPRRFGAVRDYLMRVLQLASREEAGRTWQTLVRWLRHFLGTSYELAVPRHSEVVFRRKAAK